MGLTDEPTIWEQPPACKHERTVTDRRMMDRYAIETCIDCGAEVTHEPPTITEFLLARIADREVLARDMAHQAAGGLPLVTIHGGGALLRDLVDPARILSECEATRRAVDAAWDDHKRIEGEWGMGASRSEMDAANDVPVVVAALAAVHADHPDYQQEWAL